MRPGEQGKRRIGVLAAAVAGTALLVAGCGGGSGGAPTSAQSNRYQKALAFVQCMRTHGEPTFPDPTSQGMISDAQASITPQILATYRQCVNLLPPGSLQLTGAQREQLTAQALRRAECMRAHGVLNFPDPGALGSRPKGPPPFDPNSPVFQAAARTCNLQFGVRIHKVVGPPPGGNGG